MLRGKSTAVAVVGLLQRVASASLQQANMRRAFDSVTFGGVSLAVHVTLSRVVRSGWAFQARARHHTHAHANYRAETVASFGRTGVRFLIMPVVGLTAITFSHSEIVIRLAELVVAPVLVLYTLTSMGSMVLMAMEEGRRADELAAAATHVVGSGQVAAAAPQMSSFAPR